MDVTAHHALDLASPGLRRQERLARLLGGCAPTLEEVPADEEGYLQSVAAAQRVAIAADEVSLAPSAGESGGGMGGGAVPGAGGSGGGGMGAGAPANPAQPPVDAGGASSSSKM